MRWIAFHFVLICLVASSASAQGKLVWLDRIFGATEEAEVEENPGSYLEQLIEDNLSGEGREVEITGFAGALSGRATLETLTIADTNGVWLDMSDVVLDWNRGALLRGRIEVAELSAETIQLPRLPEPAEDSALTPEASGFSLPELPVSIAIDKIEAARVEIGAPVLGVEMVASAAGALRLADGDGSADLEIRRLDGVGDFLLDASYSNTSGILSLDLGVVEGADGILSKLAGLPGRPALEFSIKGEAPIDAYAADIRLATDGSERLSGRVTTEAPVEASGATLRIKAEIGGDIAPVFAPEYQAFFGPNVSMTTSLTTFADGRITLDDLALAADAISLNGQVEIAASGLPERIDITGQITSGDGRAVLLPLSGAETRVDRVDLRVGFDAAAGDLWSGEFRIAGLERAEFSAEALTLAGTGRIRSADEREVTAELDFDATALDFGSADTEAALGEQVTGSLALAWTEGAPLTIENARIAGESYRFDGGAIVTFLDDGPNFEGMAEIRADRLSAFSGLVSRTLGGSAALRTRFEFAPLAGTFDITAKGEARDLTIGQAEADQILAGAAELDFNALRDETGLTVFINRLRTPSAELTGRAEISSGGSSASFEARLADVGMLAPGIAGPVAATGRIFQMEGDRLEIDIAADGPGGTTARVMGGAAADFSTLDLSVTGNVPLGLANRFIEPRSLSGTAEFDLAVNGPPALASVTGRITSRSARFVAPEQGVTLDGLTLEASLGGGRVNVTATATVSTGGRVAVSGPIDLAAPYAAELGVELTNVVLTDPRLYETTINGRVTVSGPLRGGARISGDLSLGETNVRIPSTGLGGTGEIPQVIHINEPPPVRGTRRRAGLLETTNKSSVGPVFPLDVRISAPNRVFVRGRGLDSEFGGDLRITGTTRDVVPIGAFNLIRGGLDILGQRLDIEEATITIQGSFVPVIRFRATTQADDTTVSVLVFGPATNPDISFTSEPELPEEEVLARLIFGRGIETLSPVQAARLALAVRTLAGRGGESIVGNIRRGAGLADFDVTTDEEGNAALRAGAYLGENAYTDVNVGADGETRLNLNLDVTPSVTLRGSTSNTGDTSIGIFIERDY